MWKTNKSEDIKELVLSLPDDSPYLQELRRAFLPHTKVLLPSDRIALSLRDPAFEYHFAAAYDRAGKTLPAQVISASICECTATYVIPKQRAAATLSVAKPCQSPIQPIAQCKLY